MLVAALGQPDQVRPGAARDVEHPADRPPGEALEAVDEEVDLALAVHVEGDLVEPRARCTRAPGSPSARSPGDRPTRCSIASRMTQEAAIPVRPLGSQAWATSTRSPPMTWQSPSMRTISSSSGTRRPPGSGEPVPGASRGIEHVDVDRHVERVARASRGRSWRTTSTGWPASTGKKLGRRFRYSSREPVRIPTWNTRSGVDDVHHARHGRGVVVPLAEELLAGVGVRVELQDAQLREATAPAPRSPARWRCGRRPA